jgi:hypothetical protein
MIHGPLARMGPFHGAAKRQYMARVRGLGPIAYWPLDEASGTVAVNYGTLGAVANGEYRNSVTLGAPGIGDGRTAAFLNGSSHFINLYSAALAVAFKGAEGTVLLWARVANAGVWIDAATRDLLYLGADTSNRVRVQKTATNNTLQYVYTAGGTAESEASVQSSTDWFSVAITWSKSADRVIYYFNGGAVGSVDTVLGTWTGNLSATLCIAGAATHVPGNVWSGSLAHIAVADRAWSPAEVALVARPF